MLPMRSTLTCNPASSHQVRNRSRPRRSSSVRVCRLTPPFGVAPISAMVIRLCHNRSPSTLISAIAVAPLQAPSTIRTASISRERTCAPAHGCRTESFWCRLRAYEASRGEPSMSGPQAWTGTGYGRRTIAGARLSAVALALALLAQTCAAGALAAELGPDEVRARIDGASGAPPDLADLDLAGLDLAGVEFRGADLRGSVLKAANLEGADLSGANLDLVILRDANLKDATLAGASAFQTVFSGGDLAGADLSGAEVIAKFERSNLQGANLAGANLAADMSNQSMGLLRAHLTKANLAGANLSGATLSRCTAEFADFTGADLSGADLSRCELAGADFTGARLAGADFTEADVQGARFDDVTGREQAIGLD